MASYKSGDTIRLLCTFKDFADQLADPELVSVKIYDQKYVVIETISVSLSTNKISEGSYFLDYTIPAQFVGQNLFYEWYAEIGGVPSLNRSQFSVVFI